MNATGCALNSGADGAKVSRQRARQAFRPASCSASAESFPPVHNTAALATEAFMMACFSRFTIYVSRACSGCVMFAAQTVKTLFRQRQSAKQQCRIEQVAQQR